MLNDKVSVCVLTANRKWYIQQIIDTWAGPRSVCNKEVKFVSICSPGPRLVSIVYFREGLYYSGFLEEMHENFVCK